MTSITFEQLSSGQKPPERKIDKEIVKRAAEKVSAAILRYEKESAENELRESIKKISST